MRAVRATVTKKLFIGFAPVNQIAHTRCRPISMHVYATFSMGFPRYYGRICSKPDEKQAIVSFDVSKKENAA